MLRYMDAIPIPSLDLDELLKADSGFLRFEDTDVPFLHQLDAPSGVLDQFALPTEQMSPKCVVESMAPVVALPTGQIGPFNSSEGSGTPEEEGSIDGGSPRYVPHVASTKAERKERIRAKNRRAQNRYREKQKALRQTTEVALNEVITDVERLRLENERLLGKNAILEKVLDVREYAASMLDASKTTETAGKALLPLLPRLAPSAPPIKPHVLANSDIKHTEEKCDENGRESKTSTSDLAESGACPLSNLTLAEIAAIKASGHAGLQAKYREVADRLRDALTEIDNEAGEPRAKAAAQESLRSALWDIGCMCFEHAVVNPMGMQKLLAASVFEGASSEADKDYKERQARWAAVAQDLELTTEQCERIYPLRMVFLQRIDRVARLRQSALAKLQVVPDGQTAFVEKIDGLRSMRAATMQWLEFNTASQDLAASLQEEHVACMEFVAKAFGANFTPIQKARAIVGSYPDFPDVYAITTAANIDRNLLK